MRNKKYFFIGVLLFALLISGSALYHYRYVFFIFHPKFLFEIFSMPTITDDGTFGGTPTFSNFHTTQFFDEKLFLSGLDAEALDKKIEGKIRGGIVPHHMLPSDLITRFFKTLQAHSSTDTPLTVIILGPNHYEKGDTPVLISQYAWKTPFGEVYPDLPRIQTLLATTPFASIDEETVYGDHSATAVIPYIKYFLPQAKIIPIVISGRISESERSTLVTSLQEITDEHTLVIASVDFSHYLSAQQAAEMDKETYQMMSTRDYTNLLKLSNDHVDAPATIVTFLQLMDTISSSEHVLLENTNSGILLDQPHVETTSYFSMVFVERE